MSVFELKYVMTVQEASNHLFEWFETNDNFEISKDLKKVAPILDNQEADTIAFRIALENLEEANLLSSKEYADKTYYILEKHMDGFQQSVDVGPLTARFLSSEINEFCTIIDDQTDSSQTANITEKDIRNSVHIIQFYKQKLLEKEALLGDVSQEEDD